MIVTRSRRTPSPRRGEGWGEGARELQKNCGLLTPALVVPGHDASHATSAARYLEECLPRSEYWGVPVERQDEAATNARVLEFLRKVDA
jgi:hypothetical protein